MIETPDHVYVSG